MCGIFGLIANKEYKIEQILHRLELLEYRGYDSAGYSSLNNNIFTIKKEVGYIKNLIPLSKEDKTKNIICHTRWATHGEISIQNTHPHLVNDICLVHNGIIDNHMDLVRKFNLQTKLISNCDSEIIAHLIDIHFQKYENSIENLIDAIKLLNGSYSILIQCKKLNNTIYGAKYKSPLYVGKMEDGFIFSSDLISFQGLCEFYYELDDGEFFQANNEGEIIFFNSFKNEIHKTLLKLQEVENCISLNGFNSFLEKEINEIPKALCDTLFCYANSNYNLPNLKKFNQIHIIGCGTAYHSACLGKYIIENNLNIPCTCHIASEFLFEECLNYKDSLFIFISQSGETYDTIECVQKVKKFGQPTLGITNTKHSQLSKLCNFILPIHAGKEISVASTKVFNCTILAFYYLCNHTIQIDSKMISALINRTDEQSLSIEMCNSSTVIFIGKCEDYALSMESVLKFRELTYRNTICYPCGELKHGTLSVIDENTLTIAILTQEKYLNSILATLSEIKTRKGKTALITNMNLPPNVADKIVYIPNSKITPINLYSIIPMQKLALYSCNLLNLNADKPRNLAKSVTVH